MQGKFLVVQGCFQYIRGDKSPFMLVPMSSKIIIFISKNKVLASIVASVIGAFVLLNYVALPLYVYHGGTLAVPDVTGQSLDDAQKVLISAGLQSVVAETRPDPKQPVGVVVQQTPKADAVVKSGRRVYLTLSGGEQTVTVPSLRGRSLRDARFALERNSLTMGQVGYDTSALYPENTVMSQSVQPNSSVARGEAIGVTVSRGKVVPECTVPQVTGVSLAEAERRLADAGLRPGKKSYQPSPDLLPNTVIDQFPRSGDVVPRGQGIDLFIVKAGQPVDEIPIPPK